MSTNLTLTWTQIDVSQRNGIIIRYMIQYGVGTNRNITITTPSSATTHLITGLKPLTEYTFTVAGVNSANTGPFSGPSEVIRTVAANSMFYKGLQVLLVLFYLSYPIIVRCLTQHFFISQFITHN